MLSRAVSQVLHTYTAQLQGTADASARGSTPGHGALWMTHPSIPPGSVNRPDSAWAEVLVQRWGDESHVQGCSWRHLIQEQHAYVILPMVC